jgi:hypothetical protein
MPRKPAKRATSEKHQQPARPVGQPRAGFFKVCLCRRRQPGQGRVYVAAEIRYEPTRDPETGELLDRSWYYLAVIDGRVRDKPSPTPSSRVWFIWHTGIEIGFDEFEFLLADRRWARRYAPEEPEANPTEPVDWRTVPLPV